MPWNKCRTSTQGGPLSKLTLARVLICLGTISIAAVRLAAGGADERGVVTVSGAAHPKPAKRAVVFSNFGKKNHLYEDTVAWDVAGPDSGVQQQWVAMPFTPSFDAQVTQISVAVEHNTGS